MSAGQMRQLVTVLIPVLVDDGEGGQRIDDWKPGPRVWAEIRPVSGREQALAGAIQTIVTHQALMHYDHRVTVKRRLERVNEHGPVLNILGVRNPDGKKRLMEVDLEEVV